MARQLLMRPLAGYELEIARWLWALVEVRCRTVRLAGDLDQTTLDWEGADERENAIGSLLYHIALVEMEWLYQGILGQEFPLQVRAAFPREAEDEQGRLTRVPGVPLADHLGRLERSRAIFLDAFRGMSIDDWRCLRKPAGHGDVEVTPEWGVFHLVEHEAGHAFQISSLKARTGRLFGRRGLGT